MMTPGTRGRLVSFKVWSCCPLHQNIVARKANATIVRCACQLIAENRASSPPRTHTHPPCTIDIDCMRWGHEKEPPVLPRHLWETKEALTDALLTRQPPLWYVGTGLALGSVCTSEGRKCPLTVSCFYVMLSQFGQR